MPRRSIAMRAPLAVLCVAACGGARATPHAGTVANRAPAPIDAGAAAAAEPDAAEENCDPAGDAKVRIGGRDLTARVQVCDLGEDHPYGDDDEHAGFVIHHKRADLILDRAGDDVTTTLATWDDGWEDGTSWSMIGALAAPGGETAIVVEAHSWGPAPDLEGSRDVVQVWAVRGAAWEQVHEVEAAMATTTISSDGQVVTVGMCNPPAGATPTGGSGCDTGRVVLDGDGKVVELRWDGQDVAEQDVTEPAAETP